MELADDRVRAELMERLDERYNRALGRERILMKLRLWEGAIRTGKLAKRLVDVGGSLFFLLALSPVFLLTAVAIIREDRGPLFFSQKRVGKDGRVFNMYKFRSMHLDAETRQQELLGDNESTDGVIFKMKDDPRITRVGKFIRRFSIDETPQFLNVLRGEMSLVGPRPLPAAEVAQFTLEQRKRLHVVPGITCIWQVSGRSDIPFQQQVQLDLEYIRSKSLWFDFWLLFRTVYAVFSGRGAY